MREKEGWEYEEGKKRRKEDETEADVKLEVLRESKVILFGGVGSTVFMGDGGGLKFWSPYWNIAP